MVLPVEMRKVRVLRVLERVAFLLYWLVGFYNEVWEGSFGCEGCSFLNIFFLFLCVYLFLHFLVPSLLVSRCGSKGRGFFFEYWSFFSSLFLSEIAGLRTRNRTGLGWLFRVDYIMIDFL